VIQSTVDFQGWLGDEKQADFRHRRRQRGAGSKDTPTTLSGLREYIATEMELRTGIL
jgi:hypothetical protein